MSQNFVRFILIAFVISSISCKLSSNRSSSNLKPTGVLSFLTTRDGNFEIYTMTTDGLNTRNLTNNKALDFWSSWSPDGKHVLFYSNRDGKNQIYRMDADGKNQIRLAETNANDFCPVYSPDGKKIAFTSDRDHKEREIYIMNTDGTEVKRITHNTLFEETPSWSKDSKSLIFTRIIEELDNGKKVSNGEIFKIAIDGKNEQRLTYKKGYDSGAKFSPNGKMISFYGATEQKKYDIFICNTDGKNILNLTNDDLEDYSPSWSPDSKWIAYTSGKNPKYEVAFINLKTRVKSKITNSAVRSESPVWVPK